MNTLEKGSHPYALAALYRYLEYKARRDTLQMMTWVVESVVTDLENGVIGLGVYVGVG